MLRAGRSGDDGYGGAGETGGVMLRTGGGALRGGEGELAGGSGIVRDGRPGARRLGGLGAEIEGLEEVSDLPGGGGGAVGMEGGLPNVGGLASKECEYIEDTS